MKQMRKLALLLCTLLAALLLVSCGIDEDPIGGGHFDEPIGGDWHVWRGYSEEYDLGENGKVLLSYFNDGDKGGGFGYDLYDSASGGRRARLTVRPETGYKAEDVDKDQKELLLADLDGDGAMEMGVPMKDGKVLWYNWGGFFDEVFWEPFSGMIYLGRGDADGQELEPPEGEAALNVLFNVHEGREVDLSDEKRVLLAACTDGRGEHWFWVLDNDLLKDIRYPLHIDPEETGYTIEDVNMDRFYGLTLAEDRDGDGESELGVPMLDGTVAWYKVPSEGNCQWVENEELDAPAPDAGTALDAVNSIYDYVLEDGDMSYQGEEELFGQACAIVQLSDSVDALWGERFAVAPDGTIYTQDAEDRDGWYVVDFYPL